MALLGWRWWFDLVAFLRHRIGTKTDPSDARTRRQTARRRSAARARWDGRVRPTSYWAAPRSRPRAGNLVWRPGHGRRRLNAASPSSNSTALAMPGHAMLGLFAFAQQGALTSMDLLSRRSCATTSCHPNLWDSPWLLMSLGVPWQAARGRLKTSPPSPRSCALMATGWCHFHHG